MRAAKVSNMILAFFLASYGITNFVLFVMSLVEYRRTKGFVNETGCVLNGTDCEVISWRLFPLLAAAAAFCFVNTSLMLTKIFSLAKETAVDPLSVFRGMFFSLLVLTSVVVLGHMQLVSLPWAAADQLGVKYAPHYRGFTGTFLVREALSLEMAVPNLSYYTVLLGIFIGGVAVSMAVSAGIRVGLRGLASEETAI